MGKQTSHETEQVRLNLLNVEPFYNLLYLFTQNADLKHFGGGIYQRFIHTLIGKWARTAEGMSFLDARIDFEWMDNWLHELILEEGKELMEAETLETLKGFISDG